jgi:hypothetical protein
MAVLMGVVLSLVIYAAIQVALPDAGGPRFLAMFLCCVLLPIIWVTGGIASSIQPDTDRPTFVMTPVRKTVVVAVPILSCIAFAAWPKPQQIPTPTPTAAQETITDPASRARVADVFDAAATPLEVEAHEGTAPVSSQ